MMTLRIYYQYILGGYFRAGDVGFIITRGGDYKMSVGFRKIQTIALRIYMGSITSHKSYKDKLMLETEPTFEQSLEP